VGWSALLTAGVSASFYEVYEGSPTSAMSSIICRYHRPIRPRSATASENARLNSRSVRTALTSEMWDTIQLSLDRSPGSSCGQKAPRLAKKLAKFLRFVLENLAAVRRLGLPDHAAQRRYTGSRGLALHLERADNTARHP